MTTKKATKKQKEAHEFVLSLSVQELLRILPADLKPAQLRKQDAQVNQVIAKLQAFQAKEKIDSLVFVTTMLWMAANWCADHASIKTQTWAQYERELSRAAQESKVVPIRKGQQQSNEPEDRARVLAFLAK
jgi:hypothetical protein